MKIKEILLIVFLALLLHDASCAFLKDCCGTNEASNEDDRSEEAPLLGARPTGNHQAATKSTVPSAVRNRLSHVNSPASTRPSSAAGPSSNVHHDLPKSSPILITNKHDMRSSQLYHPLSALSYSDSDSLYRSDLESPELMFGIERQQTGKSASKLSTSSSESLSTSHSHHNPNSAPLPESSTTVHKETSEHFPTNIKDYELLGKIGKGTYSVVMKAKIKGTEKIVAIKIIDKNRLSPYDLSTLREEARIMKMIKHPHIIKLLQEFEDEKEFKRYLVMEYASKGNVLEYLKEYGPMNEADARDKFGQIIDAVVYLHGINIVHRDLKPENMLINEKGVIKLADFGIATNFTTGKPLDKFPGSRAYAPPEMIQGELYDGPMAEVWTLGVVLYQLLTGKLAFYPDTNLTTDDCNSNIVSVKYERNPPGVSSECIEFIKRFIVKEPTLRCKLKDIQKDENNWLNAKN